jgi:hypothetical protein
VGSEDLLALPGFFVLPVIFLSVFSKSSFMLFRLDSYSSLLFVLFSLFALVPIAWFRVCGLGFCGLGRPFASLGVFVLPSVFSLFSSFCLFLCFFSALLCC